MMLLMQWLKKSTEKLPTTAKHLSFGILLLALASCASKQASVPAGPSPNIQAPSSMDAFNQGLAYVREHPASSEDEQVQRYLWLDQWVKVLQDKERLTPEMSQEYWTDFDSFLKNPVAQISTFDRILPKLQSKLAINVASYSAYQAYLQNQRIEDSLGFLEKIEEDGTTDLYARAQQLLQLNKFQPAQGSRKLGVLLPLSGDLKNFAQEAMLGIQIASRMAIAESVEFIIEDTGSDANSFQSAWDKLATKENVAAILGPLTAKETEMAFERAELMKVPVVSLAAREDLKTYGPFGFRSVLSIEDQVRSIAKFMVDQARSKKVAMLIPDSNYGWDVMDRANTEFKSQGLEITEVQVYPANATDFKDALRRMARLDYPKLRKSEVCPKGVTDPAQMPAGCVKKIGDLQPILNFDTLFVPDFADTSGLVLPTLPFLRMYGVQVVGLAGMNSKKLLERAGEAAEGVIFTDSYLSSSDRFPTRIFREEFMKIAGREPSRIAAEAFDLALVSVDIMTRDDKNVSRDLFVERLSRVSSFEGATGLLNYDSQKLKKQPEILIVRNGEIRGLK